MQELAALRRRAVAEYEASGRFQDDSNENVTVDVYHADAGVVADWNATEGLDMVDPDDPSPWQALPYVVGWYWAEGLGDPVGPFTTRERAIADVRART